jgi:hypothetical protein
MVIQILLEDGNSSYPAMLGTRILATSPFRNGSHLPTTQCACADFVEFAMQRNGGSGRGKDL